MDSTSTAQPIRTSPTRADDGPPDAATSTGSQVSAQAILTTLYGPVLEPLAAVENRLVRELQSPYESLVPLLRHGTQLGGKRLRPAMLLLAASATGEVNEHHVVLGTVIEMVHTATLVHDDVLDEAETRRHVPTVNARWNNHTSILLGDYLFAQSFRLAATLPSTEACRQIGEASRRVCEGEMRQIMHRETLDLDEESYLEIIRSKTAELCRIACHLGAQYCGAPQRTIDSLARFGDAVGVAFQIADDYLDLWGDDESVGKTLGTDVEQGKMTLPLIRMLDRANESQRQDIVQILKGPAAERLARIRPHLERGDARQYTRDKAESFRRIAITALEVLDDSPAKRSLRAIADFSIDRRF